MTIKDRTGKGLERLVAMLESVLAGTEATIESPSRRLKDRDTNTLREHDVLITWDHGHHRIITAIECRDRSRPVGVPDIEAFADKCVATGVNSGVIVSATGFRNTARIKAAARSITCMDLSEVERFDWLATDAAFVSYQRRFGPMALTVMFKDVRPDTIVTMLDASGNELTTGQIVQMIANGVPQPEDPESEFEKIRPLKLHVRTEGWTARDSAGDIWPIDHILADTNVTMKRTINPIETHRYVGGGKDYAVASVGVDVGEIAGRIVMVRNEDDTTSVFWTADKHGRA